MKRLPHIRKLPLLLGIGLLSVLSSGCSSLQTNDSSNFYTENPELDRVQRHAYAGVGVGASWLNPDTSGVDGVDVDDRVEPGGQVTLGMDLSRQLSLELHSADLGSAGISPEGRINYHLHGASALIYAGGQRHNFKRYGLKGFGRLGFGMLENSTVGNVDYEQVNNTHVLIGAGLEYMTRSGFGARAEVVYYDEDVRYGQLAMVYRTGKRPEARQPEIVEEKYPEPTFVAALPITEPVLISACSQFEGSFDRVNYVTDSDQITQEGQMIIQQVASHLNECQGSAVRVSGHTDSVGSEQYNRDLSQRRAQGVVSIFVQMGIQAERVQADSFGETMPVDTNNTVAGRSQNRRVELLVQ